MQCTVCDYEIPTEAVTRIVSTYTFTPKREQDLVRKEREQKQGGSKGDDHATVNETCPRCSHGVASFFTMQLRSADEGQTVFYTCLKCTYKWSVNN